MPITMQGSWRVSVKSTEAGEAPQRFIISGATTGNGTYTGDSSTPPVNVTGNNWVIITQIKQGNVFVDTEEQITFPTLSGGQYSFDIQANTPGDPVFDDLILTCSTPAGINDFLIYGNVSYYNSSCIFNPCHLPYLVIDTAPALTAALQNAVLSVPFSQLYPQRTKVRLPVGPGPGPDPAPFRPLVLPLNQDAPLPGKISQVFKGSATARDASQGESGSAAASSSAPTLQSTQVAQTQGSLSNLSFDRIAVSNIVERLFRFCQTGTLPGVVLKFQEYDRSSAELAGAPYSGTGSRDELGVCATDRNGNYIFRFRRSFSELIHEELADVAPGEDAFVQSFPDVIVQLLDTMNPNSFCFESAPYWNIPHIKRVNICVPKDCIGRPPTACQGHNAIQAIGNILIGAPPSPPIPGQPPGFGARVGFSNTLTAEGRITARNATPGTPQARCAAWAGLLDLFACFIDHPEVTYYTIRHRRHGTTGWNFFLEKYTHAQVAKIGIPGYSGDLVGPLPGISLHIDGGPAVPAPAYLNIENDNTWVLSHRDRKAVINSAIYAPAASPGPVDFRIEGYNASGAKVTAADDTITLYIDNSSPQLDIDSVTMAGQQGGDCALFNLNNQPATPLTVKFAANQLQGFMNSYAVTVRKGNIGGFALTSNVHLSGSYTHNTDLVCSSFEGTFDDLTHDGSGYVTTNIVPASGHWLEPNQPFCTFAVQLACSTRVTNGYNSATASYGPIEYLLGIQAA